MNSMPARTPGALRRRAALLAPWLGAALLVTVLGALAPREAVPDPAPLALSIAGSGKPPIVLIHGLGQDRRVWGRVAQALEARYQVVAIDLPSHGGSPASQAPTLEQAARALDRALRDHKIAPAVLVGHSYGALVALREAADHTGRVRGIVAIDITTYTPADTSVIARLDRLMTERYPLFLQGVFRPMTQQPDLQDSLVLWALEVPQPMLTEYFRDAWKQDLRPQVGKIKAPVLVIATEATWPHAESWASARRRLGYETAGPAIGQRIQESGHLVPLDQPDSLAAAIGAFAASLER
jgi:pimeloyl-ACP methyl ester carboxylesterase